MADKLYHTAVVIGNTLAGLVAAQTLTDFFERVTLLQLGECTDETGEPNDAPGRLHDDLLTHPQIRIIDAHEPVVILLHASGTFAIGVRYYAADEATQTAPTMPLSAERAVIADLIVDGRLAQPDSAPTLVQIEGLLMLRDAPAHLITQALRHSLAPQHNTTPLTHTLVDVVARYELHLHRGTPQ